MSDRVVIGTFCTVTFPEQEKAAGYGSCRLDFDPREPYQANMFFADGTRWFFALELLEIGVTARNHTPAGIGDVCIWRESAHAVVVELRPSAGVARVYLPVSDVKQFLALAEFYAQTPELPTDEELAEWIGGLA